LSPVTRIVVLYSAFAALATAANLGTQAAFLSLYDGWRAVELSILAGTIVGLPLKYVLEKRYVFSFRSRDLAHDGRLFFVYSLMGVFTTCLFWGIEYLFHWLFNTDAMRYLGGAIGLAVGYVIKYHLDKRFVFVIGEPAPAGRA